MATIRARKGPSGKRYQWRVVVQGFAPVYGTCPTKACAQACSKREEESLRSGLRGGGLTVRELLERFREEYLPQIPDSAEIMAGHLAAWEDLLGDVPVPMVTPERIAAAKTQLQTQPGRWGKPRKASTVNRYLSTLSSAFAWAAKPEVRLAASNPVLLVGKVPGAGGRLRWLSRPVDEDDSELERLLRACDASEDPILADVVRLLLLTGCRKQEVMGLRRSDVRLAEGGFTLRAEVTKTDQARFVPLEGDALEIVRRRLAAPRRLGNDHLFPGRGRGPANFPRRAWRAALERAGIEDFRVHDLRHTHGSYLAMMGKTLPEIMAALGHRTPAVALRYVHLADDHKRRVSAEVGAKVKEWSGR